jgi:hypothetical protein
MAGSLLALSTSGLMGATTFVFLPGQLVSVRAPPGPEEGDARALMLEMCKLPEVVHGEVPKAAGGCFSCLSGRADDDVFSQASLSWAAWITFSCPSASASASSAPACTAAQVKVPAATLFPSC